MSTTLRDIAKFAGVSVTTVSVVLRNDTKETISPATRKRVVDAARTLNYQYNIHARTLRKGRSHIIGLLMTNFDYSVGLSRLRAIDCLLEDRGFRALVRETYDIENNINQCIEEFLSNMVEGIILVQESSHIDSELIERVLSRNVPIITLEPLQNISVDCVTVDRRHGAYIAAKHLIEQGHRRIGLLHGLLTDYSISQRFLGYQRALQENGIDVDDSLLIPLYLGHPDNLKTPAERAYESVGHALQRGLNGMTALLCSSDIVVIGAMKAFSDANLRVPEDIAVVGFDNIEIGKFLPVPITTIEWPIDELANMAVELLLGKINKKDANSATKMITIRPKLIIRESSTRII